MYTEKKNLHFLKLLMLFLLCLTEKGALTSPWHLNARKSLQITNDDVSVSFVYYLLDGYR